MQSRRKFLQNALYTAPVVLTVGVRPAFAGSGYGNPHPGGGGGHNGGNGGGYEYPGGGGFDLGSDGVTPPGGGSPGTGRSRSGGNKDRHDWWQFWRKL